MEIQVVEKRRTETPNTDEVLTKGRDFVRYDEWTHRGLCNTYRMIKVLSSNMLEVAEYHYCQFADEEIEDEDMEELGEGRWARVETDSADSVMTINSFKDFNEVYQRLHECITRQDGWGKTIRCTLNTVL
jgi:hypothetical protein